MKQRTCDLWQRDVYLRGSNSVVEDETTSGLVETAPVPDTV